MVRFTAVRRFNSYTFARDYFLRELRVYLFIFGSFRMELALLHLYLRNNQNKKIHWRPSEKLRSSEDDRMYKISYQKVSR